MQKGRVSAVPVTTPSSFPLSLLLSSLSLCLSYSFYLSLYSFLSMSLFLTPSLPPCLYLSLSLLLSPSPSSFAVLLFGSAPALEFVRYFFFGFSFVSVLPGLLCILKSPLRKFSHSIDEEKKKNFTRLNKFA